jgi:hypothetical protein
MPWRGCAKRLTEECPDIACALLERAVAELMGAQADAICGAAYGERSPRAGELAQRIPPATLGHPRRG